MKVENFFGITSIIAILVLVSAFTASYREQKQQLQLLNHNPSVQVLTSNANITGTSILDTATIGQHSTAGDCWLLIQGSVYDATQYLQLHPGGQSIVLPFCGADATSAFLTKGGQGSHSRTAFTQLGALYLGQLNEVIGNSNTNSTNTNTVSAVNTNTVTVNANTSASVPQPSSTVVLNTATVAKHNTATDCWLIISGKVYAVSGYLSAHPGGRSTIIPYCGRDATQAFATQGGQGSHSNFASQQLSGLVIGTVGSTTTTTKVQQIVTPSPTSPTTNGQEEENDDD
ncbi:MAG: cytochrome b5-like heme/steroid binding domain-containing protein [Patescibacteria group bacterium]